MQDKGLKTALKCSEGQRQAPGFEKKFEQGEFFADEPEKCSTELGKCDDTQGKCAADDTAITRQGSAAGRSSLPGKAGSGSEILPVERRRGRPKGAQNKSTKEWVEYFLSQVKESPLLFLGKLYAMPTELLARKIISKREDALKMQIAAANAVLPYVHQKQPVALEIASEELPTIQIFASPTLYQQFNNGSGQVKRDIVVEGIASTTPEEISLNNNELDAFNINKSEKKV